jgi:hypothetical protein
MFLHRITFHISTSDRTKFEQSLILWEGLQMNKNQEESYDFSSPSLIHLFLIPRMVLVTMKNKLCF